MINENKKNTELIRNDISKLYKQMNKQFNELKINNNNTILNNQEIKYNFDHKNETIKRVKYIGQVLNGVPEGKGIMYWSNGDRYDGDWKNDTKDGKGIYYWNDGDIFEGDFKNGKSEGKGIYYWNDGEKYEGEWKNGNREGRGIMYVS